jgi:hypothetical protein
MQTSVVENHNMRERRKIREGNDGKEYKLNFKTLP